MGAICQRSPCDRFLQGLGRYIVGRPVEKPNHYVQVVYAEDADGTQYEVVEMPIDYCPFCGTRLAGELDEGYLTTKKARAKVPKRVRPEAS